MKKIFLSALAGIVITAGLACSNSKLGRQPSSYEAMAEIEKFSSSANYSDNKIVFMHRLSQFVQDANSKNLPNKTAVLNQQLSSARDSFEDQCGYWENVATGCGSIVNTITEFIDGLQTEVNKGNFSRASKKANDALLIINKYSN